MEVKNIYDTEIATFPIPLASTKILYKNLAREVKALDGLIILCHINKF